MEQSLGMNIMQQSLEIFKNGAAILQQNKDTAARMANKGQNLIDWVDVAGVDPDIDQNLNDFVVECNQERSSMESKRKPITQMMTVVQKEFTGAENSLDPTKKDSIAWRVQQHRNGYAKTMAEKKAADQKEAADKAAKLREYADIKAMAELDLLTHFANHLLKQKQDLQNYFASTTLETLPEFEKEMREGAAPAYNHDHFNAWSFFTQSSYQSRAEVEAIVIEASKGKYGTFGHQYRNELMAMRNELLMQVPIRTTELQQLADADADLRQSILDNQAREQKEAADKLQESHQSGVESAVQQVNLEATAVKAEAVFTASYADTSANGPETRAGFSLAIKSKSAYAMIFELWFKNEGITLDDAAMQKKTIGQMVKFVADLKHKGGAFIDNPAVEYVPTYKAVSRKAKAD